MGKENVNISNLPENNPDSTYKTELCRTWIEKNFCPYKEKCRFAHGKRELHEKYHHSRNYKQKDCKSFFSKGFCPYGPRCQFKHDERKITNIPTCSYYQNLIKNAGRYLDTDINGQSPTHGKHFLSVFESVHDNTCIKSNNIDTNCGGNVYHRT
jgi:hypothetical protein